MNDGMMLPAVVFTSASLRLPAGKGRSHTCTANQLAALPAFAPNNHHRFFLNGYHNCCQNVWGKVSDCSNPSVMSLPESGK